VQLEHFGSSTGGRVIHQEGLGGGLGIDLGLPYFAVDETHRRGMLWRFELGGARLLASHRPEGADYRSTMDLLSISGALVYKYTWLDSFADVSLAVGPGFSFLRVFEEFDDGTPDLDETLVLGLSLSPIMRVDFHDGFFGGTTFVEASVALTAARLSPYADQYDSLIAGLSPFMVTPRARVGELWEVTPGFEVGVTYEFEVVGGLVEGTSFSNALALTLRWSGYVED
jgi:hypothetical protein